MKIAIIGAGATGLAAAYDLSKWGHEVKIYERDKFLGGHASTFNVSNVPIERGYHHWFTSDLDIINLCEEIGLGNRIGWFPSKVGTLFEGKIYDFVTPLDLLKYRPLSLTDRFKLGLSALKIKRIKDWKTIEGFTAVQWFRENVNRRVFESFWEPMLRGKFGEEHYREVGMAWVWGKMNTRFASRKGIGKEMLGYPIGSFKEFFDRLGERAISQGTEIHLDTSISKIRTSHNKVQGMEIGEGSTFEGFDAVIASIPSNIFEKITEGLTGEYRAKLTSVDYMSAILLILVLDRPLSNIYWLNVADRSVPFVGVIEHTNLIGASHYNGNHIVYLSNYLTPDNEYYRMNSDELLDAYLPHISKINPSFDRNWILDYHHHRIDGAQPIVGAYYSSRMPPHETGIDNLYLANTTQVYPEDRGTNYSVKMGRKIALRAEENLRLN